LSLPTETQVLHLPRNFLLMSLIAAGVLSFIGGRADMPLVAPIGRH
jgi:hypothetical protein